MLDEKTAESWSDAIEKLYVNSFRPDIGRYRSHYAFRGLSDKDYQLKSSLMRLGGDYPAREKDLLRNFCRYAQVGFETERFSVWKWLSLGQHHGLSTRMLDWTYSPLIALHFATENVLQYDKDGVVWCVDSKVTDQATPTKLKDVRNLDGGDLFTIPVLEKICTKLESIDELASDPFVLFFESPSLDERIVNQFAFFSIMSDPTILFDEWLDSYHEGCRRVIIPKEIKWEIRDKLDQANITERVLFPGLDGLSTWLRRYYYPKQA